MRVTHGSNQGYFSPWQSPPDSIEGIEISLVENYKYLDTVFENRLCFQTNTDAISKKVQQCL